jgi:hypothetical protein
MRFALEVSDRTLALRVVRCASVGFAYTAFVDRNERPTDVNLDVRTPVSSRSGFARRQRAAARFCSSDRYSGAR